MDRPFNLLLTDLDGTLLDERTYGSDPALPALRKLQDLQIPVVFCTSKTLAETVHIQERLGVNDPFIVENGGAIYFRPGQMEGGPLPIQRTGVWRRFSLGFSYPRVVSAFRLLQGHLPGRLRGVSEMTVAELAQICGLSEDEARRAKDRQYDEPFMMEPDSPDTLAQVESMAGALGMKVHRGGRFHHLCGPHDKGQAVEVLLGSLWREETHVQSVGIGDSPNDLPMLQKVNLPVLVQRPSGAWDPFLMNHLPHAYRAKGVGPVGWNEAVLDLLGGVE